MNKPNRPKKPDSLKGKNQRVEPSEYINTEGVGINLSDTYNLNHQKVKIKNLFDDIGFEGSLTEDEYNNISIYMSSNNEVMIRFKTDKFKQKNPNYESELQSYKQYLLNLEKYESDIENFEKLQQIYNEWVRITKQDREIENAKQVLRDSGYEITKTKKT